MRSILDKICSENQNTHFMFSNFFLPENSAVYGIMWENVVDPGRPQVTNTAHALYRAGYLRLQTHTHDI
jgi:hypothetical protein